MLGPSETGKLQHNHIWLKIATFQPTFGKIYFFSQHPQPLYEVMEKEVDNLEFVQRVNIEFVDSLKNNDTKYLLIFYNPSEETCNSKAFDDIASAERHRGLSTIYTEHNWFHHSKFR